MRPARSAQRRWSASKRQGSCADRGNNAAGDLARSRIGWRAGKRQHECSLGGGEVRVKPGLMRRVPAAVWIGLALAVAFDTLVQIIWKSAVLRVPTSASTFDALNAVVRQ